MLLLRTAMNNLSVTNEVKCHHDNRKVIYLDKALMNAYDYTERPCVERDRVTDKTLSCI